MMMDTRREFLRKTMLGAPLSMGAGAGLTSFLGQSLTGIAQEAIDIPILNDDARGHKILVLIQLDGGNDGLNTVVPWGNRRYYQARRSIAIKETDAIKLEGIKDNQGLGLHPELNYFSELFKQGKLAVINNVGYANPNRSHFRSGAIWESAMENASWMNEDQLRAQTGWLGRYFDQCCAGEGNLAGVYHGKNPLSMRGESFRGTSVADLENDPFGYMKLRNDLMSDPVFRKLQNPASGGEPESKLKFVRDVSKDTLSASDKMRKFLADVKQRGNGFPQTGLGKQLGLISQFISQGASTRVYIARIGGFDTHSKQLAGHAARMKEINDAVQAFMSQIDVIGVEKNVAVMTFSEFGRQLKENGTQGTDHGAAAPMFLIGGGVKGGIYGNAPKLKGDMVADFGGLVHEIDFRSVYRSVLEQYLGVSSSGIISDAFAPLKLYT